MVAPNMPHLSPSSSTADQENDGGRRPSPSAVVAIRSTPSSVKSTNALQPQPSTPPAEAVTLDERVAELESKLATLSRLLHSNSTRNGSTSNSSYNANSFLTAMDNTTTLTPTGLRRDSESQASVPPLDSPFPALRGRRLSNYILDTSLSSIHSGNNLENTIPGTNGEAYIEESLKCPRFDLPLTPQVTNNSHHLEEKSVNLNSQQEVTLDNHSVADTETVATDTNDSSLSVRQKWFHYLESFQESNHDVDLQMQEFIQIPMKLEMLLNFGFFICVDSYLYILTILPVKFVYSVLLLLLRFRSGAAAMTFHRRHFYNLIQVSNIYVVYRCVLLPISIGQLYHWIRGQHMLKLYVLIAMVEVFDRLMCSLGQDVMDSLYWNTTRRPKSTRMLVSVVVMFIYTTIHTLILFVHVATLNVAINSSDHALLTLLISGNFAEIKSTVFKKYNKPNLFKITASDICERFKLALFLSLVMMLSMTQGMDWKMLQDYGTMCGVVCAAELLSDWIKHSFITKFNFIPSKVYTEYGLLLAGDVTGIGHEGVNLDHSHAVVKRIGLAQIPLVCVTFRLATEALRYQSQFSSWIVVTVTWSLLFLIKLGLGWYLQRVCRRKLEETPALRKTPKKKHD